MLSLSQKIISSLVLAPFLTIVLFSFAFMTHGLDGQMSGDCPFSSGGMGVSLCPQDTLALAIHHISVYNAFLNVPVGTGLIAIIISMIFAVGVLFVIFIRPPFLGPPAFARVLYHSLLSASRDRKIIAWLSLFENSPSL